MAQDFHLKLITQRAAGGDPIVRERRVAGPDASIGRAADNDIVLTDLSVDLQHARLRATAPGRVTIESVGPAPFSLDGKSTRRADVDVASRPVLVFGSYQLSLEPGEDAVVVTVTRDEQEHVASPSVFSLKAAVFSRRRMAWALGVGIALVCLLIPIVATAWLSQAKIHPDQQWSTGPLSKAHAFLENDCKSCHVKAFVAARDEACLSCHKAGPGEGDRAKVLANAREHGSPFQPLLAADHAPHDKLRKAAPLPDAFGPKVGAIIQRALNHPTDRCASCHIEHTRPTGAATADAKAPLADKPTLVVQRDCQSCHANLKTRLGATTLADTPDWGKHAAFRPLIMTAAGPKPTFQRMALTGAPQERSGLTFPHRLHLDPQGGVARQAIALGKAGGYGAPLECAACHRAEPGGTGFKPIEMERDCAGCHSLAYARVGGTLQNLPHGDLQKVVQTLQGRGVATTPGSSRMRPGTIRPTAFSATGAGAYRATFSRGGACYDCHTVTWSGDTVQMAPVKLAQRYLPRGGFNHAIPEHGAPGPAKQGAFECADCHKAATSDRATDVLIPDLPKCATCHGKTTAQIAAADDAECSSCHSFHAPGQPTPKPGHPPLETLRWTQMTSRPGAGG